MTSTRNVTSDNRFPGTEIPPRSFQQVQQVKLRPSEPWFGQLISGAIRFRPLSKLIPEQGPCPSCSEFGSGLGGPAVEGDFHTDTYRESTAPDCSMPPTEGALPGCLPPGLLLQQGVPQVNHTPALPLLDGWVWGLDSMAS